MSGRRSRMTSGYGWTLLAPCLVLVGCGYALMGRGANIPAHVEEIYVSPLTNETRRSEVEQILSRAISEELVTRKRFTVVNEAAQADAVLGGAVLLFEVTPLVFDDQGRATEYEIAIHTRMAFREVAEDRVLWKNDRYVYKETYPVEISEAAYFDRERLAIEEAAGHFARTVVIDLLQGF